MISYDDINKVNSELKTIDLKGKNYAMVSDRVNAFRKLFPEGFITTEIVSHEDGVVLMKASAGYYDLERQNTVILGTGFAQEVKNKGLVNGTSYIENCETSAVGRALGFMGLGIDGGGICSAEELVNAITAQRQMEDEKRPENNVREPVRIPKNTNNVTTASKLPAAANIEPEEEPEPVNPVKDYLTKCMIDMREARQIDAKENNKIFREQRKALIKAKLAPDKPLEEYTMEEAMALVDAMYKCFEPTGTELKTK